MVQYERNALLRDLATPRDIIQRRPFFARPSSKDGPTRSVLFETHRFAMLLKDEAGV
jgi:hypothetical protein